MRGKREGERGRSEGGRGENKEVDKRTRRE